MLAIERLVTNPMVAVAFMLSASVSQACTLCIGFPEKTATDYLMEAECVVLARPPATDPFSYEPAEVLKGNYRGDAIGLLVDTRTRRLLSLESDRWVVLVQNEESDDWRSLGIASDAYLTNIRRLVVQSTNWKGEKAAQERWQFFLPLFGSDDPSIAELAYLEMGRAPYEVIRKLGRIAPRASYAHLLTDPKYLEWRSLAILLLAQSDSPQDQRLVRQSFQTSARLGMTTNLGAWAAAVIQMDEATAIEFIEKEYFLKGGRTEDEINAVVQALSMHGNAAEFQNRIVESYRVLLLNHPAFATQVANDLHLWKRKELADQVARCLKQKSARTFDDKLAIQRYLRYAAETEELVHASN